MLLTFDYTHWCWPITRVLTSNRCYVCFITCITKHWGNCTKCSNPSGVERDVAIADNHWLATIWNKQTWNLFLKIFKYIRRILKIIKTVAIIYLIIYTDIANISIYLSKLTFRQQHITWIWIFFSFCFS